MFVELEKVNKTFGSFQALKDVSFGIEQGKIVGLLGPSGSGKTTILRSLAGLEFPDSGIIRIAGRAVNDVPARERGVGFVFQSYALFRYMTVFDNIAFGLSVKKKKNGAERGQIPERVHELINLVGLKGMEKRYPAQLSGGQRQRVAFARALAPQPQVLLLDEPFAAIDAKVRKELRTWLREMINRVGITSIFVTHDQDEAIEVADDIVIVNEGGIEQKGSPAEIYQHPATPFAARFIGQSSELTDYSRLHGFLPIAGFHQAVIRPEFVHIFRPDADPYPNSTDDGLVEQAYFRGSVQELHLNVCGQRIIVNNALDDGLLSSGDRLRVLVSRMFLVNEREVRLAENASLRDVNPVFI
ncbi:MAG: sulfate ABC transporter ATP-binding protein [Peptococcaceae bacterium]|jgi:sulfate transport system ATP-binding protein|nr:sulfate ABC transporter ATP-binding protein [Peptococcaceae bacterium]